MRSAHTKSENTGKIQPLLNGYHFSHFICFFTYYVPKPVRYLSMNNCTNLYFLSTIACQLAECIPDNDELVLLATSVTALGDMLSVMAARRDLCKKAEEGTV